jgi:peptidoglycan glycosyltransferase
VNTPLRKVGLAMLVMVLLLLANTTYLEVFKADEYRADPRNQRVLLEEYARQRGQIVSQDNGQVLASVKSTNDRLKYQRVYANGPLYAPVTGFYSVIYGSKGIERADDEILNGSDDRLFVRRLSDLITGRDPRGGNVVVTINPKVQQAAYKALTDRGYRGAVVAIKPQTGEILAMVTTPSYDPNTLASHTRDDQVKAWSKYTKDPANPMLDRAIQGVYAPGSTFKLVIASAALEDGRDKNTQLMAANGVDVISGQPCDPSDGSTRCLSNYGGEHCGSGQTASMETAIELSCNTAFADLSHQLGEDKVRDMASKYGIGDQDLEIPMPVETSCIGPRNDGQCMDVVDAPALYQTGIGQRDVGLTPLQNAMISATIANGGNRMRPQLVEKILGADLTTISDFEPEDLGQVISQGNATQLRDMMLKSEQHSCANGCYGDNKVAIASKTGTAEKGVDPKKTPPFAWYVGFAPADNPQVAVAVVVESREVTATGGKVSGDIGRMTMYAALGGS